MNHERKQCESECKGAADDDGPPRGAGRSLNALKGLLDGLHVGPVRVGSRGLILVRLYIWGT